ncbi:MAG: hypothetical protein ACE5KZ_06490 [Candidatus Scalinduaceae bacterium]
MDIKSTFDWYDLFGCIALILIGIFYFARWFKRKCWVPKYIHTLAVVAFICGCYISWIANGHAEERSLWKEVLLILLLPCIVYLVFVFIGGAEEAEDSKQRTKSI